MPPKKGIFKKIKVTAKDSRGSLDTADIWNLMINNGQYEEVLAQYKAAASDEQEAARAMLNEIQDDFGNLFYTDKQNAEMGWAEGDPEQQEKIANFMKENMMEF